MTRYNPENATPRYKIVGNAYISKGAARRVLRQISDAYAGTKGIFYQFKLEKHQRTLPSRLNRFLSGYRAQNGCEDSDDEPTFKELLAAEEAGIFAPPPEDGFLGLDDAAITWAVDKVIAHNSHENQCSGHKLNVYRKRKHSKNGTSGKGFRFRPEIPYHLTGNGEYMHGLNYPEEYDILDEDISIPRYNRRNHPEQSMPKIEWPVVRRWKNGTRPKFPTTKESQEAEKRLAVMREFVINNPREAFRSHSYGW